MNATTDNCDSTSAGSSVDPRRSLEVLSGEGQRGGLNRRKCRT